MSEQQLTAPISIASWNANRRNASMHAAFFFDPPDIFMITEPWWGSIANSVPGSVNPGPEYSTILPVELTALGAERRPRVLTFVKRTRSDFQVISRPDLASERERENLGFVCR